MLVNTGIYISLVSLSPNGDLIVSYCVLHKKMERQASKRPFGLNIEMEYKIFNKFSFFGIINNQSTPFWMDLKIREYVRGQIRTPLVVGAFLGRFENV